MPRSLTVSQSQSLAPATRHDRRRATTASLTARAAKDHARARRPSCATRQPLQCRRDQARASEAHPVRQDSGQDTRGAARRAYCSKAATAQQLGQGQGHREGDGNGVASPAAGGPAPRSPRPLTWPCPFPVPVATATTLPPPVPRLPRGPGADDDDAAARPGPVRRRPPATTSLAACGTPGRVSRAVTMSTLPSGRRSNSAGISPLLHPGVPRRHGPTWKGSARGSALRARSMPDSDRLNRQA